MRALELSPLFLKHHQRIKIDPSLRNLRLHCLNRFQFLLFNLSWPLLDLFNFLNSFNHFHLLFLFLHLLLTLLTLINASRNSYLLTVVISARQTVGQHRSRVRLLSLVLLDDLIQSPDPFGQHVVPGVLGDEADQGVYFGVLGVAHCLEVGLVNPASL